MSQNKKTVQAYMDAFGLSDHPRILDCLTDDVEWVIPGAFHLHGKVEFDREIENEAFVGRPAIAVTRLGARIRRLTSYLMEMPEGATGLT